MAELIGYETGALGIPGLSNAERVRAPKAKDTRVASTPRDTTPNSWDTVSKGIAATVNLATTGFNIATKAHIMQENEKKQLEIDSAKKVKAATTELSTNYTKWENTLAFGESDVTAKDYDPTKFTKQSKLQYLRNYIEDETAKINSNDALTQDEKTKVINYLDAMVSNDVVTQGKAVAAEYKKNNITDLSRKLVNKQGLELANPKFSLQDIVAGSSELVNGLEANGAPTTGYEALKESISELRFNNTVIQSRYAEAQAIYADAIENNKQLPEGFVDYYGKVMQYKAALDRTNTAQANKVQATIKDAAKKRVAEIEYNVSEVPPIHINTAMIQKDNIGDTLRSIKESLRSGSYAQELKRAGIDGVKFEKKLDAYAKKTLAKTALIAYTSIIGENPNIDTIPKEYQPMVIQDITNETLDAIQQGHFGVLNESANVNPKIVRPIITKHIKGLQKKLLSDPENYQQTKQQIQAFMSELDTKHIVLEGNDLLKYNIMKNFDQAKYIEASSRIDAGERPPSIPKTKENKEVYKLVSKFPLADQKTVTEDIELEQFVTGEINEDDLETRYKQGDLGDFRVSKSILSRYPDAAVLKNVNIDIPEGSHINMRADGLIRITKGGATIRTITKEHFDKMYRESNEALMLYDKIKKAERQDSLLGEFLNLFQ